MEVDGILYGRRIAPLGLEEGDLGSKSWKYIKWCLGWQESWTSWFGIRVLGQKDLERKLELRQQLQRERQQERQRERQQERQLERERQRELQWEQQRECEQE